MLFFSVKTRPIRTNRLQKPQFSNHALPHLSYLQSLPHSQNPYASISCITNDLCTLEKTIGGIPPQKRSFDETLRFLRIGTDAKSRPSFARRALHPFHEAVTCSPASHRHTSVVPPRRPRNMPALTQDDIRKMHAYWRAANYLTVGQIYLKDNALLERPLTLDDVKPRLLGHWGTTSGLNFIYTHLNRVIKQRDLNMMYIIGPGHGGPGIVAHTYLEGSYTELYPYIERNTDGIKRLFRQFSWPYGIPSHVAPETPGSIHEGGELGDSLLHAYGAAFDNPDLVVACIVGDGEAETGPCATSWHSNKFLDAAQDGAVLPILHLNGAKIAGPTVLARIPHAELVSLFEGYGYKVYFVEGHEPALMHQQMAATMDAVVADIRNIQEQAR